VPKSAKKCYLLIDCPVLRNLQGIIMKLLLEVDFESISEEAKIKMLIIQTINKIYQTKPVCDVICEYSHAIFHHASTKSILNIVVSTFKP